ncbi:expressed unknown protein [Seminavis robusta]|uniref:Transmembrane protein n=1 Tax=Seminavis robusta TaxID=568900 RepID=A0A9N8DPY7_9STRA|nr:expressed unknown protein [Seminavis robusta]|eukprot:Sro264_g102560.1 n/a (102) ;mRNA; f:49381-49686
MTNNKLVSLCLLLAVLMMASSVSALGSNWGFAVLKKRRRAVKDKQDKEVQLASLRDAREKVTQPMDVSTKVGSRRSPPPQVVSKKPTGWERMMVAGPSMVE